MDTRINSNNPKMNNDRKVIDDIVMGEIDIFQKVEKINNSNILFDSFTNLNCQFGTNKNAFIKTKSEEFPLSVINKVNSNLVVEKNDLIQDKQGIKYCRVCLEQEKQDKMINPCRCKGSMMYVHEECLRKWITKKFSDLLEKDRPIRCEICKYAYKIERVFELIKEKVNPNYERFSLSKRITIAIFISIFPIVTYFILVSFIDMGNSIKSVFLTMMVVCSLLVTIFCIFSIIGFYLRNRKLKMSLKRFSILSFSQEIIKK